MSKKKGNFIDLYLDKIILGLTAVTALYLMWAFVLSNPYGQEVGNQKLSPSRIDSVNLQRAQIIQDKLGESVQAAKPYTQNKAVELSKMLDCPMPKISIVVNWPLPGGGQTDIGGDRQYLIPLIPAVENVKLAPLRGTVRMPIEDLTPEIPYASVESKAQDMDIVTLSAKLNLQLLYDNFRQSFMGMRLKPQWRDPVLADPVIARIELQRRVQGEDNSWGNWETVPFARINPYQKTLRDIPLTTEQMTYGTVDLFMNSCRDAVMKYILQPPFYDFLSTQVKWLPAQYYLESQKLTEDQEMQRQKEERERRQRERTNPTNRPGGGAGGADARRQPGAMPGGQPGRGGRGGRGDEGFGMGPGGPMGVPVPVRPVRPTRTVQDIEREANTAKIDEKTKLNTLKDVMVWIHDDSVVAGATYQYRIRLGVFNPIAGKEWFAPESQQYKNQVILWSAYTEIADSVKIPKMLHLFPMDVLSDGSGVAVDIYKYYMGQWHTQSFDVHYGQMIGKTMESKPRTGTEGMAPNMMGMPMEMPMVNPMGEASQPLQVDFSTGYMLMDVQVRTDWIVPSIRSQTVSNMLYLDNQNRILILATKKSNVWPRELNAEYNAVRLEASKAEGVLMEGMMQGGEGFGPGMINRVQDIGGL